MVLSNILDKNIVQNVQLETMEVLKNALLKSFGPYGSNTIIYKEDALPRYTKDGHTILSSIKFNGAIEKSVHTDIEEETRTQAVKIGDSTTSITILSALIFKALVEYQNKHESSIRPAQLVSIFKEVTESIKTEIRNNGRPATVEDMYNIALTSTNNNKDLANEIATIYKEYGLDVYVDVKASMNGTTYVKEINGMTLECGFLDPTLINNPLKNTVEIVKPKIYAFKDPVDTAEMGAFLDIIIYDNIMKPMSEKKVQDIVPTIIMAPKISRDFSAYMGNLMNYFANTNAGQKGFLNIITNITGCDIEQYEDICDLCGCKYIKKYLDPEIQKQEMEKGLAPTPDNIHEFAGTAELVESDTYKTTFINPSKMYDGKEFSSLFNQRVDYLQKQINKLAVEGNNTTDIYTLKKRLNSLKGKMVEVYIGGVTVADRDAERDLMEDAVLNCRSAAMAGVGYGANYEGLRASNDVYKNSVLGSNTDTKDSVYHDIAKIIYEAYVEISKYLYESASIGKDAIIDTIKYSVDKCAGPYNIITKDFDGKVISSIDTDICIIDTISKIITIMSTANQFILPNINNNIY